MVNLDAPTGVDVVLNLKSVEQAKKLGIQVDLCYSLEAGFSLLHENSIFV